MPYNTQKLRATSSLPSRSAMNESIASCFWDRPSLGCGKEDTQPRQGTQMRSNNLHILAGHHYDNVPSRVGAAHEPNRALKVPSVHRRGQLPERLDHQLNPMRFELGHHATRPIRELRTTTSSLPWNFPSSALPTRQRSVFIRAAASHNALTDFSGIFTRAFKTYDADVTTAVNDLLWLDHDS